MKKIKRFISIILSALIIVTAPVTSYMEVQAAQLVMILGGVALDEILASLFVTAGVTALGVETVKQMKKESTSYKNLEQQILNDPAVSAAMNDISTYKENNSSKVVNEVKYVGSAGVTLNGTLGKGLNVTLSPALVSAAKAAAKSWADSEDNDLVVAESEDLSGTENVNYEYMTSIETTVKPFPSVGSMKEMDSYFSIDGCYDYLESLGYSDSDYYFLVHAAGSYTYIQPIPLNYSVVGYKVVYMGSTGTCVIKNSDYKNSISACGVRDSHSFANYFSSIAEYSGEFITFNHKTETFSVTNSLYLPSYDYLSGRYPLSNWYTVNYQNAYLNGACINYTYYYSAMERMLYTYKTVTKNLKYDLSYAPSLADGVTFTIPESDYEGITWDDYSDLLKYIQSLSSQLEDLSKDTIENQEQIIQQNKDILGGINTLSRVLQGIGTDVGKIAGDVALVASAVRTLPMDIARELGGAIAFPDDLADDIADAVAVAVADAIAIAIPDIVPWNDEVVAGLLSLPQVITDAISDVTIAVPEIVIPEIVIPEIVIPEIDIPDVFVDAPVITLDPTYDITVDNDFTGLEGIIANAVTAVLTALFVPDEVVTLEKVATMQSYFQFTEDIKNAVADFKTFLFGITPSPILKIPIGKPTSKKYNYGIGNYLIIDVSWYDTYKPYGDKVLLALAWAFFLWRIFIKLPGIISGSEGSILSASNSYNNYLKSNDSKKGK
ncbi:MAG: hypothetical protein U0L56_01895 [Lachnospiraceae bacterium]|nr:hypothetical protein [Lachnospiraceae bacterium]